MQIEDRSHNNNDNCQQASFFTAKGLQVTKFKLVKET